MKTYSATIFVARLPKEHIAPNGNTQKTVVVATTSWKRAAELLGISLGQLRPFASITGNADAIKQCEANPERPFYIHPQWSSGFHPLKLSGNSLIPDSPK